MDKDALRVKMTVEGMQDQIMHYFDGYEALIKGMVEEQLTPENLAQQIAQEIKNGLGQKIGWTLDKMVNDAVQRNTQLQERIDRLVGSVVKQDISENSNQESK